MFNELRVSEELLKAKSGLNNGQCKDTLDKLWQTFPKGTAERKEADHLFTHYKDLNSAWVVRKTPAITTKYNLGKILGNPGQYGVVKEVTLKQSSTKRLLRGRRQSKADKAKKSKEDKSAEVTKWAVKIVSKRRFRDRKLTAAFFSDLRAEAYLMSVASDHPYIIRVESVFEDINNVYIVMDHCEGGELFDRIQDDEGFCESKAAKYMRQMMSAVYYLHGLGIAHCDLKPENFILRHNGKDADLVLIDFGMAKIVRWRQYYKRMNGTPYYIAPEVLGGKYNESCDIWSLGVIMFIMVFGFPPFFDENEANHSRSESDKMIYRKIQKGFTPKVMPGYGAWFPTDHPVSAAGRDLMSRLLRKSVADRITSEEALEHPWMKEGADLSSDPLERTANPTVLKSLTTFKNKGGLQMEVLKLLKDCNYLNSSQMDEVEGFFKAADKDGNGKISTEELYEALKRVDPGIQAEDVDSVVRSIDANNDGYVDYDELLSSRINRKLQSKEARLRKVFQALDLDDNGKISDSELKAALESVSTSINIPKSKCLEMIKEADQDNDGEIDYNEFLDVFTNHLKVSN